MVYYNINKSHLIMMFSAKEFLILVSSSSSSEYHRAWCTTYQDFTLCVSIFLVSAKREGKKRERNPSSLLCTIIFSFSHVGCTVMLFHTGFCSTTRNWRELNKNLMLTQIEPNLMERINVLPASSDT